MLTARSSLRAATQAGGGGGGAKSSSEAEEARPGDHTCSLSTALTPRPGRHVGLRRAGRRVGVTPDAVRRRRRRRRRRLLRVDSDSAGSESDEAGLLMVRKVISIPGG